MANLTKANDELFRRGNDERFPSMEALMTHCRWQKEGGAEQWIAPKDVRPVVADMSLCLEMGDTDVLRMNDWSFTQLCALGRVSKDTINKLSPETAKRALTETLPFGVKPIQLYSGTEGLRSLHGSSYTRLHNVDLLATVQEYAVGFEPPQTREADQVPLYCGEQDMFIFLIDPLGWTEIDGQAFAPGFFLWNSEVGRRTVGIQSFWFQAVCQNHIVWDAIEVVELTRRHTGSVRDFLPAMEGILANLVAKRDARRDGFVEVIRKAMKERIGTEQEDALKFLRKHGVSPALAKEAADIAKERGAFTIFSIVDALTRLAGQLPNAGERLELDQKAGGLLTMVA